MNEKIENLLEENRKFSPSENLVNNANATSDWFTEANEDRIEFWKKQALERITWYKEPTEVLDDSNAPFYKWFKDGELNLSYNCLDRHLETDADRVAFYWEGEPGDTQEIT
jgi:acetyl-CoA synthetase